MILGGLLHDYRNSGSAKEEVAYILAKVVTLYQEVVGSSEVQH